MKEFKSIMRRVVGAIAPMALALAVYTANSTCLFFSYQPKEPAALQRYKKG